jgi:hypothetical protein
MQNPKTFICISNYFKGPILIHLKVWATKFYLITSEKLRDKPWPHDYIDETFTWKVRISIGI